MTIRVLIVDDQIVVRAGFAAVLGGEDDLTVVGQAGDGAEALERATALRPDVVLMDIRMPGTDGLTATPGLVAQGIKVLVLTTFRRDEYVFSALRAGASGFLLKDCEPQDLVDAIRTVASGESLLDPSVTRSLIDAFVSGTVEVSPRVKEQLAQLTERELAVLREVARGLSNVEVAAVLGIRPTTVKTHVNALLGKLGLRDRVQATIFAYDAGLVRPGAS
ncbi:response regulator transcription factor [Actinocorallia longicatena]|uniref:Response regulator transcription factor n=1 Tax=Actinocorallia longicatena TaxID=111803 RepID=A0ABP6QHM8_9ACTN